MHIKEMQTLFELINHIISRHPELAVVIENIAQNVIYKRGANNPSEYFGLFDLDRKIEKWLDYDNGYFVELGANDGVSQSNTLYFEKNKNWRGILIEPAPHNYLLCLKNRATENHFFCNACVSSEYKEKFVEIIYANLMSIGVGLESDVTDTWAHARTGEAFLKPNERNFSFGALAATLNNILQQCNAPKRVDLLSLDVEGSEIEVLKGVDHTYYRFKYILVECRDINKLSDYLRERGYELIEQLSVADYMFRDCR